MEEVLKTFVGTIQQIPPVFSACKIEGKRAYELARKGEEVELKSKTLVIDELELLECDLPVIKIRWYVAKVPIFVRWLVISGRPWILALI